MSAVLTLLQVNPADPPPSGQLGARLSAQFNEDIYAGGGSGGGGGVGSGDGANGAGGRCSLADPASFHEFCRLLAALKLNYQLVEMIAAPEYPLFIRCVAEFTAAAFGAQSQYADDGSLHASSLYYLLSLWSRLVSSLPYLKASAVSHLEDLAPIVTKAYVASRLAFVGPAAAGTVDDPLDEHDEVLSHLEQFPAMCRCHFDVIAAHLMAEMDPRIAQYAEVLQYIANAGGISGIPGILPPEVSLRRRTLEGELAWLVYIVGSIVRGRTMSSGQAEQYSVIDADLSSRVFHLVRLADRGMGVDAGGGEGAPDLSKLIGSAANNNNNNNNNNGGGGGGGGGSGASDGTSSENLDLAVLYFFQQFRLVYIGEQAMTSSRVYPRLGELVGLRDHLDVLTVIVSRIAVNLALRGSRQRVVSRSLGLFQELATGYRLRVGGIWFFVLFFVFFFALKF
jgi:exportin-7